MINESKILDLIKRQKETGLKIHAFCRNEGIPRSTFYNWRKKLRNEPGQRFIPLLVNSTPSPMSEPYHTSDNDFLLELVYPNGTRLRVKGDPEFDRLRSLVCLLD